MGILKDMVVGIVSPVADAYKARQERKTQEKVLDLETKKAIAEANIAAIREGRQLQSTWEIESIRNSGHKDEWLVFLFSIPLVGAFIPGVSFYILRGFEVLERVPSWYMFSIGAMVASTFGIRSVLNVFRR